MFKHGGKALCQNVLGNVFAQLGCALFAHGLCDDTEVEFRVAL